jgi:hypothetical protein
MLGWVTDLADVLRNPPYLDSLSARSALGLFFQSLPLIRCNARESITCRADQPSNPYFNAFVILWSRWPVP